MLRLSAFCLTVLLLAGCDSAAPNLDDANDFTLRLEGAIHSDFRGGEIESRAYARLHTRPSGGQELTLELTAVRNADMKELTSIYVQYSSEGEIIPGVYHIANFEDQDRGSENLARASFTYKFESPDLSSRYSAQGRDMVLEIVRLDDGFVAGRFQVRSSEVSGYRNLYGQTEAVTLAGRVDANATFEVALVR